MGRFERMPFQAQKQVFERLAAIADKTTLTSKDRDRYDESMKVLWDNIAAHEGSLSIGRAEGRAEGLAQGRAEGRAEGLEEGLTKGLEKGRNNTKREIALMMLANGEPVDKISLYSGLSKEEIESL